MYHDNSDNNSELGQSAKSVSLKLKSINVHLTMTTRYLLISTNFKRSTFTCDLT